MRLDAAQRRALLGHPAGWIACGFGSGLSRWAPGTVGSAAALLPWLALRGLAWPIYLAVVAVAFLLGTWASGVAIERLRTDDPGVVVWDEFVGQWLRFDRILTASKDKRKFPTFTRETAAAMTHEALAFAGARVTPEDVFTEGVKRIASALDS